MFSACDCAPAPVILGYAPDAKAVGVIELAATLDAITLAPNVPALMLAAVKLERLAPLSEGNAPLPFNCTSWLLPLKTLPCCVIEDASMLALGTDPLNFVASKSPAAVVPTLLPLPAVICPPTVMPPVIV